jgi:hypothetical protein
VLVALGLACAAWAREPVRVYTNADLEPLPATASETQAPIDSGPGWDFVIDFLAEQHARIDADRSYDLDSAALHEAARRSSLAERPHYVLPYSYGYYGYGRSCGRRPQPQPAARAPLVVPLHARRPIRAR